MNPQAVAKAKARLRTASDQLARAEKAVSYEDFASHWYLFLVAAKNVYTQIEQGSKATAQSRQWFGGKKNERKSDALLQYLFQARDDDEHGIADVTSLTPPSLAVGKAAPGYSNSISCFITTDGRGVPTIHDLKSHDGLPILIEETPAHAILLPVNGRGNNMYPPPESHLGKPLENTSPTAVGTAGLAYLDALVADAEARSA